MPARTGTDTSTRERILDIALDLFVDQGYEKTSLRQIAERLGYSKAAVYYHFASKEDILLELHLRVHTLGADLVHRLGEQRERHEWAKVLEELVEVALENRNLFLLHEHNRTAMTALHDNQRHADAHGDMEATVRSVLRNASIPLPDRVRLAGAIAMGTVATLFVSDFGGASPAEVGEAIKDAVRDLLLGGDARTSRG